MNTLSAMVAGPFDNPYVGGTLVVLLVLSVLHALFSSGSLPGINDLQMTLFVVLLTTNTYVSVWILRILLQQEAEAVSRPATQRAAPPQAPPHGPGEVRSRFREAD